MSWFMDPVPDPGMVHQMSATLRAMQANQADQVQRVQASHDDTQAVWAGPASDAHSRSTASTQHVAQQHAEWLTILADALAVLGTLLSLIMTLMFVWTLLQAASAIFAIVGFFTAGAGLALAGDTEEAAIQVQLGIQAARQAVVGLLRAVAASLRNPFIVAGTLLGGAVGFGVGEKTVSDDHESGWQAAGTLVLDTFTGAMAGATIGANPVAAVGAVIGVGTSAVDSSATGNPMNLQATFLLAANDTFGADAATNFLPKGMPWDLKLGPDGQPIGDAVDTTNFPGNVRTSRGGVRNNSAYWDQLSREHPEYFSPDNLARIHGDPPYPGPRVPVADDQWLEYHPDQSYFNGQRLIHHHYQEGPVAIPLPEGFHSQPPWWGYWHPGRGGPDYIDPTTGDLGRYYRDLFSRAQRHGPFGGIFDGPPPPQPVQPGKVN